MMPRIIAATVVKRKPMKPKTADCVATAITGKVKMLRIPKTRDAIPRPLTLTLTLPALAKAPVSAQLQEEHD
jgi:hypothetical protein